MVSIIIESRSPTPLYVQLVEQFRHMIESGELKPGDQFPTELELVEKYGVARITVRRAINELVQDGLLVRRQGKGTFVARPKIERELINVSSFSNRMLAQGLHPSSKVMGVERISATAKLARILGAPEGAPLVVIRRIRYANEEPTALETSYLVEERCPGIAHRDLSQQSLYKILEEEYCLTPDHSRRTLEVTSATSTEARLLQLHVGAPLFLIKATVYTADETVMEYAKLLFRADRFRFQL